MLDPDDHGTGDGDAQPDSTAWRALAPARLRASLTMGEFYLRYVAVGGSAAPSLLGRYMATGSPLSVNEHNFAALALNERFMELDAAERLPYRG